MNADEYANLESVESDHWYYAGKRDVVRYWIGQSAKLDSQQVLLDCGAGTGRFAQEMAAHCRVLVLDDHEESLSRLRERFSPEQVLRVSAEGIPLPASSVDVVTALDVLEHIEQDAMAVREFARVLRPGGIAVVTVPASMALWSDWDSALHHFRRYNRAQLCALFPNDTWELVHVNYTNVLVYPAVWVVRKWRVVRAAVLPIGSVRTEDRLLPKWINALLRASFVRLGSWRTAFPFGVSLLLVARRRG